MSNPHIETSLLRTLNNKHLSKTAPTHCFNGANLFSEIYMAVSYKTKKTFVLGLYTIDTIDFKSPFTR